MIVDKKTDDVMATENQKARKRKEVLKVISEMCLLDDNLMTLVFDRNIEATELLLNVILQRNDLKVLEVVGQREYKNPMFGGRSITIDIYAVDRDDKVYDVEVQRASEGADPHRARFHSSMIDTKMLKARQEFKEIHDSYVIFITARDVMREGLPLYHVNRIIEETGTYFGDGSHIIYVNGSYKDDDDPVGRLMHDFRCLSPVDMFYPILAKQVKYFKETEGGQEIMCQVFEDLAEKWVIEEKKDTSFKMTYQDNGFMYICVGYGEQVSGGYSIAVNALYLTENAIYADTTLLGPDPSDPAAGKKNSVSCPYIVLKTEFIDKPVVFD